MPPRPFQPRGLFNAAQTLVDDSSMPYRPKQQLKALGAMAPGAFGHAACGLLEKSPVPRRLLPRVQERPPDRLMDDEVAALARLPEPFGFVIRLGLGTGLRWGELCRAQATDVERDMLVVSQTKSGRVRRIPLSPELLAEVRERVGRLVGFSAENPGGYARAVRRLSGASRFHVHQLRHTFACRWLERGGSLAALQQILGHSSVVTTQRYARMDEDAVRDEARTVGTVEEP